MNCECKIPEGAKTVFCDRRKMHVTRNMCNQCVASPAMMDALIISAKTAQEKLKSLPPNERKAYSRRPGPGKELKKSLAWIELIKPATATCSCNNLAAEMDIDGVKKCRQRREYYVGKMLENKTAICEAMKAEGGINGMLGAVAGVVPNAIAETWIGRKFDAACDAAEAKIVKVPAVRRLPPRAPGVRRQVYPGSGQPTARQNTLYNQTISQRPVAKPFASPPLVNLIWHIWPIRGVWERHVEKLNDLLPQITGQAIIGIVTDESTATLEEVKALVSDDRIVWIENANSGIGEVLTVERALPMLDLSVDSVTIYGHAKGIRPHTRNDASVKVWTECMYETVTFNIDRTIEKMAEGYDIFGSFRTFGWFLFKQKYDYHYSGTFFNFRTQILQAGIPKINHKYGGVEGLPGDLVSYEKSWCEFRDNSPLRHQYDASHLPKIMADQLIWESLRPGGIPIEQHVREFDWLVSQLEDCRTLLVIGSRHGGMEHHLRKRCPQLERIVSVDLDPLPGNKEEALVIGNSADELTQQKLRDRGPFDAVFIDGDHKAPGVQIDWEFAKSLDPKRIFFHDFTDAAYHLATGCEVHHVIPGVLADAAAKGWTTSSKVVGCGWGGIFQVEIK